VPKQGCAAVIRGGSGNADAQACQQRIAALERVSEYARSPFTIDVVILVFATAATIGDAVEAAESLAELVFEQVAVDLDANVTVG
jgi:hypothetical protein